MTMESMLVIAIVALAAIFVSRRVWRAIQAARKPAGGCGTDCGCGDQ